MKLDEVQKQKVAGWIDQGQKVAEIQSRLASELGLSMTYMDVRFLIDDLKLKPRDPEPPKAAEPKAKAPATPPESGLAEDAGEDDAELLPPEAPAPAGSGKVSLEMDSILRPGAIVSGKVTFSDGNQADWYLDQMGRLGLTPKVEGYKPSAGDVQSFQLALQKELARMGF